ncbi:GntR family transcriptional regulator [Burkholderia plantarii]|uniref:Transcriptional regulator, GntR family n=1 Tax=Burkholderia plantarii TaxID=41899 RepID=A0A0B6RY13_BURPL|nr:GntR family transcriptional regulator [Burkholderia plantarii]AJK45950.1 transcriptional regulator, GntR family [Burkholderia plantarii]
MEEKTNSDADHAYDEIRTRILDGRLEPGQKISHRGLASKLGIGQMPVRSALQRLAAENLVTVFDKRGTYVNDPTRDDLQQIFEVRLALESTAAYLAACRGPTPAMAASVDRMERLIESGETDIMAEQRIGWVFHQEMFLAARNERLHNFYKLLRAQTLALNELPRQDIETVRRGTKEHLAIYSAIRDGQPEEARGHMWNHIVDGTPARIKLIRARNESKE